MIEANKNATNDTGGLSGALKKLSIIHWIGVFLLIAFLIVLAIAISNPIKIESTEYASEERQMSQYLQEKYGKEFVVGNYRIEGSGLAVEGDPAGDAYPIDDPTLQFKVWDRGNYVLDEHAYSDKYLETLWSEQGKEAVEQFINTELPDVDSFQLTIRPSVGSQLESYELFTGGTLPLSEALNRFGKDVELTLGVRSKTDALNEEPSVYELERALKVFKYVANTGANSQGVNYVYKDAGFNEKNEYGQELYQYSIGTDTTDISAINTLDDLRVYFKKLR